MPVVEREITGFTLPSDAPKAGSSIASFSLTSSPDALYTDFTWTLDFPIPNAYRTILTGPKRPRPPHDNTIIKTPPVSFKLTAINAKACTATFAFPSAAGESIDGAKKMRELRLEWHSSIVLSSWESDGNSEPVRIVGDLANRSYALTENGVMRHWWFPFNNIHLGMGEKSGPLDLSGRHFQLHGQDSAGYDAMEGDPLYKHTPYVISTPKPTKDGKVPASTYAIYHPTNSFGTWDLGKQHDDPSGYFTCYTQDFGGLEEWVLVGKGVKEVVKTFGEVVGMPKLVARDWLGYLASGMGLGESVSSASAAADSPLTAARTTPSPSSCSSHGPTCAGSTIFPALPCT
jgi:hypothetical protein